MYERAKQVAVVAAIIIGVMALVSTSTYSQSSDLLWCDDFEGYTTNAAPIPPWAQSGNQSIRVVDDQASSGTKSMRAYGLIGACWGTIITRALETTFPMTISVDVRNGSENLYGCHPYRAGMTLRTGRSWTDPSLTIWQFLENGDLRIDLAGGGVVHSGFALNTWHNVTVELTRDGDVVTGEISVNGEVLGQYSRTVDYLNLDAIAYLDLNSQEGTVWFDDVCVNSVGTDPGIISLTLDGLASNPEVPVAWENTSITLTVRNNGTVVWPGGRLDVQLIGWDIFGVGNDGILVESREADQFRQMDRFPVYNVPSLQPSQVTHITFDYVFNWPDWIDSVEVFIGYESSDEMLYYDWRKYPLNVQSNDDAYMNCLGTVMAAVYVPYIAPEDVRLYADAFYKGMKTGLNGPPSFDNFVTYVQNRNVYGAIREIGNVASEIGGIINLALTASGTGVPGISVLSASWKELNAQGCSAVIGHHWDRIPQVLKRQFMPQLLPTIRPWWFSVKCPVAISANTPIGEYGLNCDGAAIGESSDTATFVFGDYKCILLDQTLADVLLSFEACDSGWADFNVALPSYPDEMFIFNNVRVQNGAVGVVVDQGMGATIEMDYDGDGIADETIEPRILSSSSGGYVHGLAAIAGMTPSGELPEITVDLYDQAGDLQHSTTTDGMGRYDLPDVDTGQYYVSILPPLGYSIAVPSREILVFGVESRIDFSLEAVESNGLANIWWWKTYLADLQEEGPREDQFTEGDLSQWGQAIYDHFFNRFDGSEIQIEEVTFLGNPAVPLQAEDFYRLFLDDHDGSYEKSVRNNMLANMLNVVSNRMHQTKVVTEDGATAGQALNHFARVYEENAGWTTLEQRNKLLEAKYALRDMHMDKLIGAGIVPLSTPLVLYKPEGEEPDQPNLPTTFELYQNYPNPFNPLTEIRFAMPEPGHVKLTVFNSLGQQVAVLADQMISAGEHTRTWDATDAASGVYFYRLETGEFVDTKKMMLVK